MQPRLAVVTLTLLACWGPLAGAVRAGVVVLANKTGQDVRFTVSVGEGKSQPFTLAKGDLRALPMSRGAEVVIATGGKQTRCHVRLNEIYYFIVDPKNIRNILLVQASFPSNWRTQPQALAAGDAGTANRPERANKDGLLLKVPVKLFVDQAEPTVQSFWEKRLRERVEKASKILESYCRVGLEVVDAGKWQSDEELTALPELLRDFRSKANPGKARLAIGFTGLRPEKNEDRVLGCTPGPLQAHILIREYRLKSKAEQLEVLVHELGHFLGACHSPEVTSVMRPRLGDGKANLRSFGIHFDPVNTLVMNLVAEELARRPVRGLSQLTASTRRRLLDIFAFLARLTPDDPAAPQYIRMLGATPPEPWTLRPLPEGILDGAHSVVSAITVEAIRNPRRRSGDELTEHYFRVAAAECRRLPAEQIPLAYTLGLAIALDRDSLLRSLPIRGMDWSKIESAAERAQRLQVLGEPTMRDRAPLLRSFIVSAAVLLLVEEQAVSAGGVQEELLLLQGSDRFRFDDLTASLAGIAFAAQIDSSPIVLGELQKSFRVADYVLSPKGLPEPLDRDEFNRAYGSTSDERFIQKQDTLRKRILALPGYQPRPPQKEGKLPLPPSETIRSLHRYRFHLSAA